MPKNNLQIMMFALMTVIVTVHAYVFYSLYVVNGSTLMNVTGADSVLGAVNAMGGVYMLGRNLPIWAVVIIEFILAYTLEIFRNLHVCRLENSPECGRADEVADKERIETVEQQAGRSAKQQAFENHG